MYINFTVKASEHNNKTPLFKFSPIEDIIAVASGSIVTIYAVDGTKLDEFDTGEPVIELSWSPDGVELVVLSLGSHLAFLWKSKQRVTTKLTLEVEEPLCLAQSYRSNWLAVGSALGHLFLYDSFSSVRQTIASKHTKRVVSVQFTENSDYIATLSPEAVIISNIKGETVAFLKEKSAGCCFVNRVITAQIKGSDGSYDCIILPVLFDQELQKRNKSEITTDFSGFGLICANVDQKYLQPLRKEGTPYDLAPNIRAQTYGNSVVHLATTGDTETVLDIQYVAGEAANFSPEVCCLLSSGNIISVSLDHSREDMAISTLDSKFKYFNTVNRREAQYCAQASSYESYQALLTDINSVFNTIEMAEGNSEFNARMIQSLSPCTSYSILSPVHQTSSLLTLNDKSINIYDSFEMSQAENVYIDFSGGKDSLGVVNNYPTNVQQAVSGNVAFVSFSNGSSMMILTKSISQCIISQLDDVVQMSTGLTEGSHFPLESNNGLTVLNITSPKSAELFKVMPCRQSPPIIEPLSQELLFSSEPQIVTCSQHGVAVYSTSTNQIQFARIEVDRDGNLQTSWQSANQTSVSQMELMLVNDTLLPVTKTLDGLVTVHAAGGIQTVINCPSKIQQIKASNTLVYCLTEKAQLLVYDIDFNLDQIEATMISNIQCSTQFVGTAAGQNGEPIGCNMIELIHGGVGCIVYKKAAPCNVQLYLAAEEILLDDIYSGEVTVGKVVLDAALINLFVVYASSKVVKNTSVDSIEVDTVYVSALSFSIADHSGPGVVFKQSQIVRKDVQSLPLLTSNGIAYGVSNKSLTEATPIPGLANVHAVFSQLKPVPPLLSPNVTLFVRDENPLLPVNQSMLTAVETENDNIQVELIAKLPEYKRIALPSEMLSMMKGCVELNNLGFCDLALTFALRVQNTNLIKFTADAAVRFCDFDTAMAAYSELAMLKIESPEFGYKEYEDVFLVSDENNHVEYLQEVAKCPFLRSLALFNNSHNNDPAAISLFVQELCIRENDLNSSMALALLLSCPDSNEETVLNQAEKLLLRSNKPSLALSFRVDSLDWSTASVLAKKISSPFVRAEILIQQAGELEFKQQYQEAIDTCVDLLKQGNGEGQADITSLPRNIQHLFIGIVSRSYAHLGKVQETRELAMPPKKDGRYVCHPNDPLNILQRARLNYDCGEILCAQKRFGDSAIFYEAAASLAGRTFGQLNKEISGLNSGEISLYDVVHGGKNAEMLLFKLLPQLNGKARESYEKISGGVEGSGRYDIQLLRQLDKELENNQRQAAQQSLPNKIQDIVIPADLAELVPGSSLSKSANCYIKSRQYEQAERLIEYISDKNIIADLARVYMRDNPEKALELFKRAGKSVEIVECLINLKKIQEAEGAVKAVRQSYEKTTSAKQPGNEALILDLESELKQSALLLAQFFRKANAPKKAIYYYILAEYYNDAFELAVETHNEDILIRFVNGRAPPDFLKRTAKYFAAPDPDATERRPKNMAAAARFLELSGSIDNAIKLLLNFGDGNADIDKAIDLLRQNRGMVDYVLKYLQGGNDGVKKNPIYIFKLYLALDRFNEASKTAYLLADREVDNGRFGRAKNLLLTCEQKLIQASQGRCPQKFRSKLVLLHAVEAGRQFSRLELHYEAGICLHRASQVATTFGDQASSIILSACVECWRAGDQLRREAYECACELLKNYEEEIPDKFRKAVDTVVRKYKKNAQHDPVRLQCCQCGAAVIQGQLSCDECQAILPLDTANGGQMSNADFCECPYCHWFCSRLGLYEIYGAEQIKAFETQCMMCGEVFDLNEVLLVDQQNFELITGGSMNYDEYDHRPLIVYEDGSLARERYELWVKTWYADEE